MSTVEPTPQELTPTDASSELANFESSPSSIHNFDGDALQNWRLTAFATGGSCRDGYTIIGQNFALKYWFCHGVEFIKEDGSKVKAIRTVLMDATGDAYGFVSEGVYESLRLLVQHLGESPKLWPVNIVVTSVDRKGGHRFYNIEPAPERYEEKRKVKK